MATNNKIFLVCTGLGTVNRGFESYISQLAAKLTQECRELSISVLAGGNYATNQFFVKRIRCIRRDNKWLNKLLKDIHQLFLVEQISFFLHLLPYIFLNKPAAIYLGEYKLYCYLFKIRKISGATFKLILFTGGQAIPGLFDTDKDFVHHVTDRYVDELTKAGYPAARQFLIPHFIRTDTSIDTTLYHEIVAASRGKKIVLSVGSLDNKVKRMVLLAEALPSGKEGVFPVFLGDETSETAAIKARLQEKFGKGNYIVKKVTQEALWTYYAVADLFVLGSVDESFGLVLAEAMLMGKPVMCQHFPAADFVTKNHAVYLPAEDAATWCIAISKMLDSIPFPVCSVGLKKFAVSNYSWEKLGTIYKQMFNTFSC